MTGDKRIVKQKFSISGMGCSACVARVEKAVSALSGIESVSVSLIENSMICEFDESRLSSEAIVNAVVDAGYGAEILEEEKPQEPKKKQN